MLYNLSQEWVNTRSAIVTQSFEPTKFQVLMCAIISLNKNNIQEKYVDIIYVISARSHSVLNSRNFFQQFYDTWLLHISVRTQVLNPRSNLCICNTCKNTTSFKLNP